LPIAPSTFHGYGKQPPSARAIEDARLLPILMLLWATNFRVYGARKLWVAARKAGHEIGRDRVARLMREAGIRGIARRWKPPKTTVTDGSKRAPDLVKRKFTASAPNRLWVTDITYVRLRDGSFTYTCFVIDVFSRAIVGWSSLPTLETSLVTTALEMARQARGAVLEKLRVHSDAGVQFTSIRWGERVAELEAKPSIGTVADSYDNALAESVNGLYKCELVHGPTAPVSGWGSAEAVELATLNWVHWWNTSRVNAWCEDNSPFGFEAVYAARNAAVGAVKVNT